MQWYKWRWHRLAWTSIFDRTTARVFDPIGRWRRVAFGLWWCHAPHTAEKCELDNALDYFDFVVLPPEVLPPEK